VTYWFYYFSKFLLWVFFRVGFGLEVTGQEHVPKRGPCILASNHVSFFDPPVLGAACPRRLAFMARDTLFGNFWLGAFMRGVHVIPIKRDAGDLAAMRQALARLRAGDVVAIFPEGGRQFSGHFGTVKRGVGLLAEAARAPVVPVVVRGTFQALPPTENRPHRAKIRVAFGPVIAYTTDSATRPSMLGSPDPRNLGHAGTKPVAAEASARERHEAFARSVADQWRRLAEQLNG